MSIHPKISSEFELSQEQVTQQILANQGDALTFGLQGWNRLANDARIHIVIRNYARKMIEGTNAILVNE